MSNSTTTAAADILGQTRRILDGTIPTEQASAAPCCSSEKQEVCCEPSEKAECCGSTASTGSCGCQ